MGKTGLLLGGRDNLNNISPFIFPDIREGDVKKKIDGNSIEWEISQTQKNLYMSFLLY